jgi:hypothetical protein
MQWEPFRWRAEHRLSCFNDSRAQSLAPLSSSLADFANPTVTHLGLSFTPGDKLNNLSPEYRPRASLATPFVKHNSTPRHFLVPSAFSLALGLFFVALDVGVSRH